MDNQQAPISYRLFIDEMVAVAQRSVSAERLTRHGHTERSNTAALPLTADERVKKQFSRDLSDGQKTVLSRMLVDERETAIHDVLSYLEWAIVTERLRLSGDRSFLGEAEETMHGDFISRVSGHDWRAI